MKVTEYTKLPSTVTVAVVDPLSMRDVYKVEMSRKEAEEAVEYLRTHNGSAPKFVHRFIDAMEIALTLKVRR